MTKSRATFAAQELIKTIINYVRNLRTMKKHLLLATMATATLFASCSNDNEEAVSQNVPVQFTISPGLVVTRTTTTAAGDTYSATFNDGDKVGVFSSGLVDASGSRSDLNNASFTFSGGKLISVTDTEYYYPKTGMARFAAYYPASVCSTESSPFAVQEDQSSEENFNKSDFMTSVVSSASTTAPIHFTMKHRLAFVELKLANMDGATVTMNNVIKDFSWNPADDEVTTSATAPVSDIDMFMQTDSKTYWALVPDQTIAQATKLFTIEYGGNTYNYIVASDLALAANKVTRISLKRNVTGDGLTDPSIDSDEWGSVDDGGSGTVTEEKNYLSMPEKAFVGTANSTPLSYGDSTNPWHYNTLGLLTAEYSSDGFFTVVSKGACAYSQTGIIGYSSEILTVGQYTLSLKIKASEVITGTTKIQIFVCSETDRVNNRDYFSILSGDSRVIIKEEEVSTTVKTISLTLDTSYYRNAYLPIENNDTWAPAPAEKAWNKGFKIFITFGGSEANPVTYTFTKLKITKK